MAEIYYEFGIEDLNDIYNEITLLKEDLGCEEINDSIEISGEGRYTDSINDKSNNDQLTNICIRCTDIQNIIGNKITELENSGEMGSKKCIYYPEKMNQVIDKFMSIFDEGTGNVIDVITPDASYYRWIEIQESTIRNTDVERTHLFDRKFIDDRAAVDEFNSNLDIMNNYLEEMRTIRFSDFIDLTHEYKVKLDEFEEIVQHIENIADIALSDRHYVDNIKTQVEVVNSFDNIEELIEYLKNHMLDKNLADVKIMINDIENYISAAVDADVEYDDGVIKVSSIDGDDLETENTKILKDVTEAIDNQYNDDVGVGHDIGSSDQIIYDISYDEESNEIVIKTIDTSMPGEIRIKVIK